MEPAAPTAVTRRIESPSKQLRLLERLAARERRSVDDLVRLALEDYVVRRMRDWSWEQRFDEITARARAHAARRQLLNGGTQLAEAQVPPRRHASPETTKKIYALNGTKTLPASRGALVDVVQATE